jgi:hypothetical protein
MIQASFQAPASPQPPAARAGQIVTTREVNPTPMTAQEMATLRARRKELSDQLISASNRREELSNQARTATGADKAGLEQRLGVLDARLARLESEIDETGRQLASAGPVLAGTSAARGGPPFRTTSRNAMDIAFPIIAVLAAFAMFPIAVAIARNLWRRGAVVPTAGLDRESAHRLERMEQAMEAIAIEVERVSEGQRFVTRLLGEQRGGGAIGAVQPAGEAIPVPSGEKRRL